MRFFLLVVFMVFRVFSVAATATDYSKAYLPSLCDTTPVYIICSDSILCSGDSTVLVVQGWYTSYLWSNGSTAPILTVSQAGAYSVQLTDAGGCTYNSDTINIAVYAPPSKPLIAFDGPAGICNGDSAKLVTNATGNYHWKNNSTASFCYIKTAEYSWLEITDVHGCSERSDSLYVDTLRRINAGLSYNFSGTHLCFSDSVLMEVVTDNYPYTYLWNTGEPDSLIWFRPKAGMKSVYVYNEFGCRKYLEPGFGIDGVNPLLPGNYYYGPPDTVYVCSGTPYLYTIYPSAAQSWYWSDGDTTTINKPLYGSPNGNLWGLHITELLCSDWNYIVVKEFPGTAGVDSIAATKSSVCLGKEYTHLSTTLNNPVWSTGSTNFLISVSPTHDTQYTVTGKNSYGCTMTLSKWIYVKQLPTVTVSGLSPPECIQDSVAVTAITGGSVYWINYLDTVWGTGFTFPKYDNSVNLIVTGLNGCVLDSSVTRQVDRSALFAFEPSEPKPCIGDSVILDLSVGNGTYLWSTGSTDTAIIVVADTSTIYNCTFTSPSGCIESRSYSFPAYTDSTVNLSSCSFWPGDSISIYSEYYNFDHILWSTGATTGNIKVYPVDSVESYRCYHWNDSSCVYILEYDFVLDTLPIPELTVSDDSVCVGDTIVIGYQEPGTYIWQSLSYLNSPIVSVPAPYNDWKLYVSYLRDQGCLSHLLIDTLRNAPDISGEINRLNYTTPVCPGQSIELFFSSLDPTYSYSWNTGDTARMIFDTPDTTTHYTLSVQKDWCQENFEYDVVVNEPPSPPLLSGDTLICPGFSTTLLASSPLAIHWSNGSTQNVIHFTPPLDQTLSAVAIDQNNCVSDTISITVHVGASATATAVSGTASICRGQNVELTATGFQSGTWSNGATGFVLLDYPIADQVYSFTGINEMGCSANRSFAVHVDDPPSRGYCVICYSGQYCDSGRVIVAFNYLGFDSLVWSTGDYGNGVYVNPLVPTWYYLNSYKYCYGEPFRDSVFVEPRGYFNAYIKGDTLVCPGANVVLNVQNTISAHYQWSTGDTLNSIIVQPNVTTTYSVTLIGEFGCEETLYYTVHVASAYADSIIGELDVCAGTSLAHVECTDISGASYLWSNGFTGHQAIYNLTGNSTPVSVTVTLNGGCSYVLYDTIRVHVNTVPAAINGLAPMCEGDSLLLTGSPGLQYQWYGSSNDTTASVWVSPDTTSVIGVSIRYYLSDVLGCYDTVSGMVVVLNAPLLDVEGDEFPVCPGTSVQLVASGASVYSWNNNIVNDTISFNAINDTSILLIGTGNCGFTDSMMVYVDVMNNYSDTVFVDTAICYGVLASVSVPFNGISYLWQNGETGSMITFKNEQDTVFYCQVILAGGCSTLVAVHVIPLMPDTVSITGNLEVCSGNTTQLEAVGSVSYIWEGVFAGNYFPVFVQQDTLITVVGVDVNGCQDTATVLVRLLPQVDFSVYYNTSFCDHYSVGVSSLQDSLNYLWNTGQITESYSCNGCSGLIEVAVTVTNTSGCSEMKSKMIYVHARESLFEIDTVAVCQNNTIILSPDSASLYSLFSWNYGSWTSVSQIPLAVTNDTMIILSAIYTSTCTATDTLYLDAVNPVQLSVVGDSVVCPGEYLNLVALSSASTVNWIFPGPIYLSGDSVGLIPLQSGMVEVTAVDTGGCVVSIQQPLLISDTDLLGRDTLLICTGDTVLLSYGSGSSWNWSTGATTQSIQIVPTGDSLVTVFVDNADCGPTYEYFIIVADSFTVPIYGDTASCANSSATFFVDKGISWLWSTGDATSSINLPPPVLDGPLFVHVTLYDGCYANGAIFHYNYPDNMVSITGDTIACSTQNVVLQANGNYLNYLWSTGSMNDSIIVPGGQSGVYAITVTDFTGCIYNDLHQLLFLPSPSLLVPPFEIPDCNNNQGMIIAEPNFAVTSVKWQSSASAAGPFSNLSNGISYSGVNSDTLKILNPAASAGLFYRCRMNSDCSVNPVFSTSVQFNNSIQLVTNQTISICDNTSYTIGNSVYNVAGTYSDTLNSVFGCDSIVITQLNVTPNTINTQVVQATDTVSAGAGYDAYQWFDCITNLPIPGATAAAYIAPPNSNVYVVIFDGNCIDTSLCIHVSGVGIAEDLIDPVVSLNPNPFTEELTISLSTDIHLPLHLEILNGLGQVVYRYTFSETTLYISLKQLSEGVYTLRMTGENFSALRKVVKTR